MHGGHGGGAVADDLVDEGDGLVVPIADGDGAAQVEARQAQLHKLTGCGDGGGIALQLHAPDGLGQLGVFKKAVKHIVPPLLIMGAEK